MNARNDQILIILLRIFALIEFVYFSLSHWFTPTYFFTSLGIDATEVASQFVRSQLQLIGAMVMGYSLLNLVVASDLRKNRDVMSIILLVGLVCTGIFIGHVAAGTLPKIFLINALMLLTQILIAAWLFPWRQSTGHEGAGS